MGLSRIRGLVLRRGNKGVIMSRIDWSLIGFLSVFGQ